MLKFTKMVLYLKSPGSAGGKAKDLIHAKVVKQASP